MAEIKWIKLSTNMFDDEKIKLIRTMPEGDSIALIWVQILCLAGKINDGGWVYMGQNLAYSDEMLATILDHPLNTMRIALQTLEQFNMIDVTNDGKIDVLNWEKHQSTDKMARIAQQNRERQQRYYYRNKLRELGLDVDSKDFTDDLEELKKMTDELEKPNVSPTLPNDTEVRSKKLEVRSKKLEDRSKKEEVNNNKQTKKTRHKYGDNQNVLMTKEEYDKLSEKFPNDLEKRINNLSYYMASTGKSYKSHYMTIIAWARSDKENTTTQNKPLDLDSVFDEKDNSDQWARWEERKNASNR